MFFVITSDANDGHKIDTNHLRLGKKSLIICCMVFLLSRFSHLIALMKKYSAVGLISLISFSNHIIAELGTASNI